MAKKPKANDVPKLRTINIADLTLANPRDTQPVYSNNAAVTYGPHDFRLTFTEIITGVAANAMPTMEMRASVAISPTHFKALVDAMTSTLHRFELQFGKIKWPPEEKLASLKM